MARLLTTGLDTGVAATDGWSTDDVAPDYVTTPIRGTTGRSLFYNAGSDSAVFPVTASSYYARWYLYVTAFPTAGNQLIAYNYGAEYSVGLNSSGQIGLYGWTLTTFVGSPATISLNTWTRIELFVQVNPAGTDSCELRVNGVSVGTDTGSDRSSVANTNLAISAYLITASGAASYYVDDVAINDTTGVTDNSWPGATIQSLTGSIPTVTNVPPGTLTARRGLSGPAIPVTTNPTGALSARFGLGGTIPTTSTLTGGLSLKAGLTGLIPATSTVTGALRARYRLTGTSTTTGTVIGSLTVPAHGHDGPRLTRPTHATALPATSLATGLPVTTLTQSAPRTTSTHGKNESGGASGDG